jgi:hypothetical protein
VVSERLTRGRLAAAAVALLTVLGVVVLVVVARGWWRGDGGGYAPPKTLVAAQVTPATSLFGQALTARARVVVDPRRIDPASLELAVDFRPFNIRKESRAVGRGLGRAAVVDFTYEIQCIARACVPRGAIGRSRGAATDVRLRPAKVTGRGRDGRAFATRVEWPAVGVQSRLTAEDIALSMPRVEQPFTPPPVSFGISPDLLGGLALGGAALLVLGAGLLVAGVLRGAVRPPRRREIPAHLTPVERALALVEHAAMHGEVDESRKALERLAAVLRQDDADEQASVAERLAWSARTPSPEAVAGLADAVRSNGAG